ncbi:hypothetical protein NM688_g6409 [Phlebia brevispora]|uniref:Uncharacterized protein n=1 Tax=Phlebia brevispora TaxID=194682 RepID=A0ACC1SGB0_9APHY|nr:hypothetical protein NM688_g6409 [Phlebia brevispora]
MEYAAAPLYGPIFSQVCDNSQTAFTCNGDVQRMAVSIGCLRRNARKAHPSTRLLCGEDAEAGIVRPSSYTSVSSLQAFVHRSTICGCIPDPDVPQDQNLSRDQFWSSPRKGYKGPGIPVFLHSSLALPTTQFISFTSHRFPSLCINLDASAQRKILDTTRAIIPLHSIVDMTTLSCSVSGVRVAHNAASTTKPDRPASSSSTIKASASAVGAVFF